MTMTLCRFLLIVALLPTLSCRTRPETPPESQTSAAQIINAGAKGIYVIRPFNEVWSKRKNEAVKVAFEMISDEVRERFPNVDVKGGVEFFRNKVDLHNVEDGAKGFIEANVDEIEGLGMKLTDFVPTAFMFVFSGPIVDELLNKANLPISTNVLMALIVVPQYVQRYVPGQKTVMESWRYKLGAGLLTFTRLKPKVPGAPAAGDAAPAINSPFRVGLGFVWGDINQPSDLSGKIAGVAMSRNSWKIPMTSIGGQVPFGNNVKVFAVSSAKNGWLQDETGKINLFKVTNVLATFEYIFGDTKYDYAHPYVGLSLTSDQLLSYLLGAAELASEEKPSKEESKPPVAPVKPLTTTPKVD